LDHAARRVELAALLALGARELREEVFVDAAEHVPGAGLLVADFDIADKVDQLAETSLVERRASIVLGQHALERRVVALDSGHGGVGEFAYGGWLRLRLHMRPSSFRRDPGGVLGTVLVGILRIATLISLGIEAGMLLLEGVGDVFQEYEAE